MANSYADDIKVKISEKYKPPCRISMPMSYSQRLSLNKQLQDSRPNYEFHFEKSVLGKMKEWKDIRKDLAEERKQRLNNARREFDAKIAEEKVKRLEKEEAEAKLVEESNKANSEIKTHNIFNNQQQEYANHSTSSQFQGNYVTKNGILMPIPVTNYSNIHNIVKPMPLEPQQSLRQTFNLSDFESDTSSPFDNMELKSINDLEELAQVLKSDVYRNNVSHQGPSNYSNMMKNYATFPQSSVSYNQNPSLSQNQNSGTSYNQLNSYNQVNTSYDPISANFSQYNNPYVSQSSYHMPNYGNHLNGYLYNIPPQTTSQVQPSNSYTPYMTSVVQAPMQKNNCKSVPDLVKSLEKELDNTRLNDTAESSRHSISSSFYTTTDVPVPIRPKSTDSVFPKAKLKDEVSHALDKLSSEQRDICKNVSLMGFPLERVARVCNIIGNDQKKIVDHLLALSELLDLGFSEADASKALVKNENDRDKALDLLIS